MMYLRGAEAGLELGQSNAAWMLQRAYGAAGPAATALASLLHQRAAGQVRPGCLFWLPMLPPPHPPWMLQRAYGAAGPAATAFASLLHQRGPGQVRT